ncbi:MAG TPA: hypothetical protein VFW53_00975 [Gallionella sp.]|nr:hypothetical protein [Gallionella sp.]
MGTMYNTKMSSGSTENIGEGETVEQMHTRDEIISHAKEVLAEQMGLDLCSFVGLEEVAVRGEDGDTVYYVDQSGRTVPFTEELQFQAAIAVLNSNGHYFEAKPVQEIRAT